MAEKAGHSNCYEILWFLCRTAARARAAHCRNLRQNSTAHNNRSRVTITFPPLIPCVTSLIMHSMSVKVRNALCESSKYWRKIYWTQQHLFSNWTKPQPKVFLARYGMFKGNRTSCRSKHIQMFLGSHRNMKAAISMTQRIWTWSVCQPSLCACIWVSWQTLYLRPNRTAQNIDKLIKVLPQNRNI